MITICIPTYKRPRILELLLGDLKDQSRPPDVVIIIDGDPKSGLVKEMVWSLHLPFLLVYVPSNHGNLSYQRYLGWLAASRFGAETIVYFDDDVRLFQPDIVHGLLEPLGKNGVVGVGADIQFGDTHDGSDAGIARSSASKEISMIVRFFGSGRGISPGELTASGHRRVPIDDGRDYVETGWLRGGAMAYDLSAINRDTFSDDLFALDHIRCGLGEDTFLSRRIAAKGRLLYSFRITVDHPNVDTPKSYPSEAYKYAYAATYSRRFINDHYRVYARSKLRDRWALMKSYAGNILIAWFRALRTPTSSNLSLARGTTLGVIHGLLRPPTAKRLTPHIDWWADAENALADVEVISNDD